MSVPTSFMHRTTEHRLGRIVGLMCVLTSFFPVGCHRASADANNDPVFKVQFVGSSADSAPGAVGSTDVPDPALVESTMPAMLPDASVPSLTTRLGLSSCFLELRRCCRDLSASTDPTLRSVSMACASIRTAFRGAGIAERQQMCETIRAAFGQMTRAVSTMPASCAVTTTGVTP